MKELSLLAFSGIMLSSCGEKKNETKEDLTGQMNNVAVVEEAKPNIVEVAAGNDAFSTLVAVVTAADLDKTLIGDGPFTVFAPTNDAFSKFPEGTVESLLLPENKDELTNILTYHVVSGKFESAAVIEAINANDGTFTVTTVQGESIELSLKDGSVLLTGAKGGVSTVIIADVEASNGVIHALDTVIMPE